MFKSKPNLTHLRTFGCICFPLLRPYNAHKLLPHTTSCIFLGYPAHTKGYICQDPLTSQVYISRHVHFNESEFLYPQPLSTGPSVDPSLNPTQPPHISIPLVTTQCPLSTSQSDVPLHASSHPLPDQSSSCQLTPHPIPTPLSDQPPSSQSTPTLTSLSAQSPSSQSAPTPAPFPPLYIIPISYHSHSSSTTSPSYCEQPSHDY